MARYKRRKYLRSRRSSEDGGATSIRQLQISSDTKMGIFIIFLFAIAALSILALFGQSGVFFSGLKSLQAYLMGNLKILFPVILVVWAYFLLRKDKYNLKIINYVGAILAIIGLTGLWHLNFGIWELFDRANEGLGGGYLGLILSWPLLKYMNYLGGIVVCISVFLVGILLAFEMSAHGLLWPIIFIKFLIAKFTKLNLWFRERRTNRQITKLSSVVDVDDEIEEESAETPVAVMEDEDKEEEEEPHFAKKDIAQAQDEKNKNEEESFVPKKFGKKIVLPLELVSSKAGKPTSGDIKNNQEVIKRTLANFNIPVEMGLVNVGPTVTQYTLRPADGVKLSKITNLNSDLALALAAHPIRIEAPIPGRSLVGIEIPNQMAAKVTMGELLLSKEYKERKGNLSLALGKDVSGNSYFANLERMPHLLIAGATGSGKSVCVNSIIVSLLYQNNPDELKFILVDPKRVELTVYNKIPYLLTPVITDVKKTVLALKWCVCEMERRFELLSKFGRRNIASYNQDYPNEKLPYIVFIIDELADLMAAASGDIEGGIVRLAQMARAVGIHLILATQRPSIEVITGLIKANIPARISFAVASLIDSRTILDASGAEKLVGRGDMLYLGPDISRPKRIQGVFLSDKEIFTVINYIKQFGEADYIEAMGERQGGFAMSSGMGGDEDGDSLLGEAKEIIAQSGKASASLLQRRLKIGYARAARILDLLEEQGIIGPADGAKAREVFLDKISNNINPIEFAAKEHDLEGELLGNNNEEPSFTSFSRVDKKEITEDNPFIEDEQIEEDDNNGEEEEDQGESVDLTEFTNEEEEQEETDLELSNEEGEVEKKEENKNIKSSSFFNDGEWS